MRYIYFIIIILLSSCATEDCFHSTGKNRTEKRILPVFTRIEVKDNIELVLVQDTTLPPFIEITAGENLFDKITTEVIDNKLIIRNQNQCNWVRDYDRKIVAKLNIHSVSYIGHFGSESLTNQDTIKLDSTYFESKSNADASLTLSVYTLNVDLKAAGDLTLNGNNAVMVCNLFDVSGLFAKECEIGYAFVWHYGSNECHISPIKELGANMFNTGNLYYYLEPILGKKIVINHSGQAIKAF